MRCMLSYLNESVPVMRCKLFFAFVALGIFFDELDYLSLLDFGSLVYYTNKLYFDSHAFAMRFSPYKFC